MRKPTRLTIMLGSLLVIFAVGLVVTFGITTFTHPTKAQTPTQHFTVPHACGSAPALTTAQGAKQIDAAKTCSVSTEPSTVGSFSTSTGGSSFVPPADGSAPQTIAPSTGTMNQLVPPAVAP